DLDWAQRYAMKNREIMMRRLIKSFNRMFDAGLDIDHAIADRKSQIEIVVNCHHNYVAIEEHFGDKVYVTRKGAINAEAGRFGIIPGSMGAKSFIIRGLGNPQSFNSCSHGAGRKMSRTKAKAKYSIKDLEIQTAGVECRKDKGVVDEIPGAYKDIEEVMRAQNDLVEVVAELKQVICVKGKIRSSGMMWRGGAGRTEAPRARNWPSGHRVGPFGEPRRASRQPGPRGRKAVGLSRSLPPRATMRSLPGRVG